MIFKSKEKTNQSEEKSFLRQNSLIRILLIREILKFILKIRPQKVFEIDKQLNLSNNCQ